MENNGAVKKKVKSRQQQQQQQSQSQSQQQTTIQNGGKKLGNNGAGGSSKKSKGITAEHSPLADELNILIRWVQSALTGVELKEKLDIPTLVEVLISIDAPYEAIFSPLFSFLFLEKKTDFVFCIN